MKNDATQSSPETGTRPKHRQEGLETFALRMGTVRELMLTLQVVTYAGQYHVMNRALDILRRDIVGLGLPVTDPRVGSLALALLDLKDETEQVLPRPRIFSERAGAVVDTLIQLWGERDRLYPVAARVRTSPDTITMSLDLAVPEIDAAD